MLTPNQDLKTKIDDNPHKLVIKYKINTINSQVDGNVKTLDFLNLEEILSPNFLLILNFLSLEITFNFII
jgi:hypothetical protein